MIFENQEVTELIQVCYNIEDAETLKREIEALKYAVKKLKLNQGTIITYDTENDDVVLDDFVVQFVPVFRLFLS